MTFSVWTCARRCALAGVVLLSLMSGRAQAVAFSVEPTPFPIGGLYIPVVGQDIDPENPLFIYEAIFFQPVFSIPDVLPGVTEYVFPIAFSTVPDPSIEDLLVTGGGAMHATAGVGGVFSTCWSLGCAPGQDLFPYFEVFDGDGSFVLRADPDAGRSTVGRMSATEVDGGFIVDSFFDIFVEVCTFNCDTFEVGDETWEDIEGSVRYELVEDLPAEVPEPGSLLLLGGGLAGVAAVFRKRRR